jgi:hypothetical protein
LILNILAADVPKKPSRKLAARFPVETKLSDKMEGIAEYSDELGPDSSLADEASCFRDTWNAMYSRYFGHFEDTSELFTLRSNPWKIWYLVGTIARYILVT